MSLTQIKISNVPKVIEHLPPDVAIMLRGPHGIGKSSLVRQINKHLIMKTGRQRKLIDRRLSQMQGGDLMGLPDIKDRSTRWNPPDWYKTACDEACDLLLDELNRAEQDVTNGFFQIALDRELNGFKLHPETRIYTGINTTAMYNVHPVDPALLDRFWVGDLTTSVPEWAEWARSEGLHEAYITWLEMNEGWFTYPDQFDPGEVQPSPRSHERCAKSIAALLDADEIDSVLMEQIARGFIGGEASVGLTTHLKAQFRFDGMDILNRYQAIKQRVEIDRIDVQASCMEKICAALAEHSELGTLIEGARTKKQPASAEVQGANIEAALMDMNPEIRPQIFVKLAQLGTDRIPLLVSVHPYIYPAILKGIGVPPGADGVGVFPNMAGLENLINGNQSAAE